MKEKTTPEFHMVDPYTVLKGDDLEVFRIVEDLMDTMMNKSEPVLRWLTAQKIEPLITEIIDQNRNSNGGKSMLNTLFPENKRYYMFVNNYMEKKGYIEIETGIDNVDTVDPIHPYNSDLSSHGYPASYGYTVYSYDRKTGEIKYDRNFFGLNR